MDTATEEGGKLTEAQSCLEFLVWALSHALAVKPRQAAGLLLQDNFYLKKIVARGVKGDFRAVREWLQHLYSHSERLAALLATETAAEAFPRVLATVATGISSPDSEVAAWTCKLLSKLSFECHDCGLSEKLWEWLTSDLSQTAHALIALTDNPSLAGAAVDVLLHASSGLLLKLFTHTLKSAFVSTSEYIQFIAKIAGVMFASAETAKDLQETGLVTYWTDLAVDSCGSLHSGARLSAFSLLHQIWMKFSTEEMNLYAQAALSAFRRGASDQKTTVRITCASYLWSALETLAERRSAQAAAVYKTLACLLLEEESDSEAEHFLLALFSEVLERFPDIALSPLHSALCRKVRITQYQSASDWSVPALTLFSRLSKHPRLSLQMAVPLIDICGRIFLSDGVFARAAAVSLASLATRFLDTNAMQEYLCRLARVMLVTVANERTQGTAHLSEFEARSRASRTRMMFSLLSWLLQLAHEGLNDRLMRVLSEINSEYRSVCNSDFAEVKRIFSDFGYFPAEREEVVKSPEAVQSRTDAPQRTTTQCSSFPHSRVRHDISRIKQQRLERAAQARLWQEEQDKEEEQRMQAVRLQLEMRKIEQSLARGVSEFDLAIFPFQSTGKGAGADFLAWEVDDQDDRRTVEVVGRRYRSALKSLFRKFAGTGFAVKSDVASDFQRIAERKVKMTEAELVKLLITCKVVPSLIARETVRSVLKGFCAKIAHQHDLTTIDFAGFCELMPQLAYCIYDARSWPPALKYKNLMLYIQQSQVTSFEERDAGDRDVLTRMNEMLRNDPDASLPTGYFLSHKEDIICVYTVPPALRLRESIVVSMELVDWVLSQALGVHFLEPILQILPIPYSKIFKFEAKREEIERPAPYPSHALSPTLKFELARLPADLRLYGHECAQALESLLVALDLGVKKPPLRPVQKKVSSKASSEDFDRMRKSEIWAKHAKAVQEQMAANKEAKAERLKREKEEEDRRRAVEVEIAKRLSERLTRERKAKDQALRQWLEQREAETAQRTAETQKRTALRKKASEANYKLFQSRLNAVLREKQEQWRALREASEKESQRWQESRESHQSLAAKLLEMDRERAAASQTALEKRREFAESPEVTALMQRTAYQRETLYRFFCKRAEKRIGMEGERELTLAEYAKMAVDVGLVPNIIPSDVNAHIFKTITRAKQPASGFPVTLSAAEFAQALLLTADFGREQLNALRGSPSASLDIHTLGALLRFLRIDAPEAEVRAYLREFQSKSVARMRAKWKRTSSSVLPAPPLDTSQDSGSAARRSAREVTPLGQGLSARKSRQTLTKSFDLGASSQDQS